MEALFAVIARSMGIEALQVEAVMTLLREGSSVPFIARYRKERTKGLMRNRSDRSKKPISIRPIWKSEKRMCCV